METDIENLEKVLILPDPPPNYFIVSCDASQLKEASKGFSSSLYQLNVRWKAPHGDDLCADVDAYGLNKEPSLADAKVVADPKVVAEAATKSTDVATDSKDISKLVADLTGVNIAADTKDNNSKLGGDSSTVGPAADTKDNNYELNADSSSIAADTKDNNSELNADSTTVGPAADTKDNNSELDADSSSVVLAADSKDNNSELNADLTSVAADTKEYVSELVADSSSVAAAAASTVNVAAPRDTDRTGVISLIVKRMPDPSLWISLNSEATFEKELNMYSLLAPFYNTIVDEISRKMDPPSSPSTVPLNHHGHPFPKFLGGRLNLKNDPNYVDDQAVILLENLKQSGYENCRLSNLDSLHFMDVLIRLAVFHAAGIIIRHDPKYRTTYQNLLKTSRTFFFGAKDKDMEVNNSRRRAATMETVEKFDYDWLINAKLNDILEQTDKKTLRSYVTCYSSLLHNDLWVNNIMFKYTKEVEHTDENKHEIEDVKFIDFQNTNFGSVAKDFIFLMYTSTEAGHKKIWPYIETYMMFYHEILVENLKKYFGEYFVREFSLDRFRDELKMYACHKLKHINNVLKQKYGEDIELYENHLKCILDHCIENKFI